jgi:subtilisin family serine protease
MYRRLGLLCTVGVLVVFTGFAQTSVKEYPSKNWFNEDANERKVNGVSSEEAYQFLHGKKSKTVIVAVIDSGIDINHEDLNEVIWTNDDEIANNGIDDDNNGFVDDIHGWNFIGGPGGKNVGPANYEVTREYRRLKDEYENKKASNKEDYKYWQEIEKGYREGISEAKSKLDFYEKILSATIRFNKLLTAYLDVDELSLDLVQGIISPDEQITQAASFLGNILGLYEDYTLDQILNEIEEGVNHYRIEVEYNYNLDFETPSIVGDNPNRLLEKGYGNNDVIGLGTDNFHGTHVAGIIAAKRDNNIGIDGIANNVRIMAIRAVPDGDERDKDVANAIRYAVDNGAKIINMSFGKAYSPNKDFVDEAIRYAEKNNVLLVHAAGNEGKNIDIENNFPTKHLKKKEVAENWLEVGASSWGMDDKLATSFSNYGHNTVDLFAPGIQIYSTAPDNKYKEAQGTSMASPVTAGVAALLLSYYPNLAATDLKEILMKSTRKFDGLMVIKPGTQEEKVDFAELSVSGGIVNAYEAVKLADSRNIQSK